MSIAKLRAAFSHAKTLQPGPEFIVATLVEAQAVLEDHDMLRTALEKVEWVPDGEGWSKCPWCGVYEEYGDGHADDCERQLALAPEKEPSTVPTYDLIAHLTRQRAFSLKTFGPGNRAAGVVNHIRKELLEIEKQPTDLEEWIDVMLLAGDGAWRAGFEPAQIAAAFEFKLAKNENRTWPDWRTADPDKAIEHVRRDAPAEEKGKVSE